MTLMLDRLATFFFPIVSCVFLVLLRGLQVSKAEPMNELIPSLEPPYGAIQSMSKFHLPLSLLSCELLWLKAL